MKRICSIGMKYVSILAIFFTTSISAQTEGTFRKDRGLSYQEQLTQSNVYLAKMNRIAKRVKKLISRARAEKDIIKLNCLNDKRAQIEGSIRVGRKFKRNLLLPTVQNDVGARNHEFSKLTITYQKVVVLGQEAEACIGEEIAYIGKTLVQLDVDEGIPQTDPTVELPPALPVIRPPLASPTQ